MTKKFDLLCDIVSSLPYSLLPIFSSPTQIMNHHHSSSLHLFLRLLLIISTASANHNPPPIGTSILFATLGRSQYTFDIFTVPIITSSSSSQSNGDLRLTDGHSVNYNGHFPSPSPSLISLLSNQSSFSLSSTSPPQLLLYVTERYGVANIYLDSVSYTTSTDPSRRSTLALERHQIPLLDLPTNRISMKDRPSLSRENLIYVSTHENPGVPRKSWAAVYSTRVGLSGTGQTRRLTPYGVADYSPSVSPSGIWTAVASHGERGWDGEIEDLETDIYVFRTIDGSGRVKVVEHGGWPCWVDDSTLYFHRKSDDGWWSVYKAILKMSRVRVGVGTVVITERVTPPGVHAFTPAATSVNTSFIVVATRRPDSDFRHIELFDIVLNKFVELTRPLSPETHHYNPFISPDGTRVGYHKCRGSYGERGDATLMLENMVSETEDVSVFRIDGSFPSFSPHGDRIAYVGLPGLYVVNQDGSGKREILSRNAFSTAWDWKRKGVVYTSVGPVFATERTEVDIVSVNVDEIDETGSTSSFKQLTFGGQNNAFPSPSPDGKWVVFRSGRSGHKNLYVIDAVEGEKGSIRRLTEGPWTDTMCNWSPDGEWIAFSSDRDNRGSESFNSVSFAIYFIHPNGTGLKKAIHSGQNGKANHPWFSPDSKSVVFTSDYAAVSSEPIANPHHFQPYGDIFVAKADGTDIQRLTHNSYEDGTPTWGPKFMTPTDVVEFPPSGKPCSFDDCHWLSGIPKHQVGNANKVRCS